MEPEKVRAIFAAWRELWKSLPPPVGGKTHALPVIHEQTQKRWFNQHWSIGSIDAGRLARAVWETIARPGYEDLRGRVFQTVQAEVPEAPCADWNSRVAYWQQEVLPRIEANNHSPQPYTFQLWFHALAGGKDNPDNLPPLDRVEVKVLVDGRPLDSAVPVHPRQSVRIEVETKTPACLYVFWITPAGTVEPLFPWEPELDAASKHTGRFVLRPGRNMPRKKLILPPEHFPTDWKFEDKGGLETVVAFARREPLPESSLEAVRKNFGRRSSLPDRDGLPDGPVSADLREIASAHGAGATRLSFDGPRTSGPIADDPIGKRHSAIAAWLGDYLDAGACVSFRNDGAAGAAPAARTRCG